jgi:radical SAM protein
MPPTTYHLPFSPYSPSDFAHSPLMFYYEVTQACDLVCKHCRASAQEHPHPEELSTEASMRLIDEAAGFPRRPMLVLTGGDPLKRGDLFSLIEHAAGRGLHVALTPSATPLATREAFARAKQAGVRALGISLDGADAATHDAFRGWEGSFVRSLAMLAAARDLDLPVQVNTTVTRRNFQQIDRIAELLAGQGIAMWSVFFLVPVGRGREEPRIEPAQYEAAFERLWHHARTQPYAVKTTEAPHFRRWVLQHGGDPLAPAATGVAPAGGTGVLPVARKAEPSEHPRTGRLHRAPLGVGDGKGVMFVSHVGEIYPAGFLPLDCGRFPQVSVIETYQHHPTFLALRDPDRFHGNCGICEYRDVCGGSRARAYAVYGDPLASEPDCVYVPGSDPAKDGGRGTKAENRD